MTITFSEVPSALRLPGGYIEIDGSQAGLNSDLPMVLLVGQKLPTGTAAAGEVVLISSPQDAKNKAGEGSMLAQMAARYRKVDSTFDIYMLPYADNPAGVAATGAIIVTSPATANGTLALYIAQRAVTVGISIGQTAAQIASAIALAITEAGLDIPLTAVGTDGAVALTARHKGTCGNAIDLRLNFYDESTPAGLGITLTAMSGGTGDPAPGDLASMIGQRWFRYVALGINDAATLAAWHTESQRRYGVPVQAGFRAFTAFRGDYAAAASFGETKNYEHFADLWLGINPPTTWESAATCAAAAATKLFNYPVTSLEGTPLPEMKADVGYNDFTQSNSLLFKGMSVMEVGKDGSCYIKRLISMYQFRSDGGSDDAYLDINAAEVMERIRYVQRSSAIKKFRGTAAAETDEGYRPGLPITTEDGVRVFLLSLYKNVLMAEYGWAQAYSYYKSTLIVEQDPDNPSRFNFRDDPVVLSPFYIIAGRSRFRKAVPSY